MALLYPCSAISLIFPFVFFCPHCLHVCFLKDLSLFQYTFSPGTLIPFMASHGISVQGTPNPIFLAPTLFYH